MTFVISLPCMRSGCQENFLQLNPDNAEAIFIGPEGISERVQQFIGPFAADIKRVSRKNEVLSLSNIWTLSDTWKKWPNLVLSVQLRKTSKSKPFFPLRIWKIIIHVFRLLSSIIIIYSPNTLVRLLLDVKWYPTNDQTVCKVGKATIFKLLPLWYYFYSCSANNVKKECCSA